MRGECGGRAGSIASREDGMPYGSGVGMVGALFESTWASVRRVMLC